MNLAAGRQPGTFSDNSLGPSPRGGPPQKGLIRNIRIFFRFSSVKFRVLKLRFFAFPEGPGGFREVREADRNHFHLSWYLVVPGERVMAKKEDELILIGICVCSLFLRIGFW